MYSIYNISSYVLENKKTNNVIKKVSEISDFHENTNDEEIEYDINFNELQMTNSDFVGYLIVPGTDISQPVVKGIDNSYYLNHNYYKEYDVAGWLFADYQNKFDGTDKNIIIYGHNMKTGTMFGSLKNILTNDWYENLDNRYIYFITENDTNKYEVFSVYKVESEDYYRTTNFGEKNFLDFVKTIKLRSIYNFNIDINLNDSIITLSTCHADNRYRVVLHAKKI